MQLTFKIDFALLTEKLWVFKQKGRCLLMKGNKEVQFLETSVDTLSMILCGCTPKAI